eukprot:TRINITY_DN2037_c0_g1_i4.p1 TRINITY_DN2037_c0_g1~~TRINITY_DN2037_c0_g1_i4.p1  ORF type:complete len:313 (-),score=73.59 TRINITY_DN2037_c0_g1_i4:66-1004(-)
MTESWIFASIINFLQSPLWKTPILTFVDKNCVFFDSEDENKFIYTEIHEKFRELVENLLETYVLKEINITVEQFLEACQNEPDSIYAKLLFDQVLSADDFITFKQMMCRRNLVLEQEAHLMLKPKTTPPPPKTSRTSKEEQMISEAMRQSHESYNQHQVKLNQEEDRAIRSAIANSLKDQEEDKIRFEAELRRAIDMSIALAQEVKQKKLTEEEIAILTEREIQKMLSKQRSSEIDQRYRDMEYQRNLAAQKSRQSASSGVLDKLFARQDLMRQKESGQIGEDEKRRISENKALLIEQSSKERAEELSTYRK